MNLKQFLDELTIWAIITKPPTNEKPFENGMRVIYTFILRTRVIICYFYPCIKGESSAYT
jgi:hypothetical protein